MKREELEQKLRALGWGHDGASGTQHDRWSHPAYPHRIYVRRVDLVPTAVAARLLDQAEGIL